MVAGVIHLRGAFGGEMSGPTPNNAKGMFENSKIRNQIVKPFFRDLGVDALGQYPLPDINKMLIPSDWAQRVEDVMMEQGYEGGPWMYKGAKMCLHWPVWNYAFPNAKWIIVRRRPGDIVNSCLRTGFMNAFNSDTKCREVGAVDAREGWMWWIKQHEDRFREMQNAGLNCKVVWPNRMVEGDYRQMKETLEWCGLEWGPEVTEFIEPKLWKARLNKKAE
jgi:hypothetical protein